MNSIKLFYRIFIFFIMLSSCSKDEDIRTNGFTLNGTFYETNFAITSSGNPYRLIIYNPLNDENQNPFRGQFAYFYLRSGSQGDGIPLMKGTYTTKSGPTGFMGVDGYHPIEFLGDLEKGDHIYSGYWHQDNNFKNGTVTINFINSVSEGLNNQVTEIDLDYTFQWNGTTVKGNYSGNVMPDN